MYTPIDQTNKYFSYFYPKEWITEFVENRFESLSIKTKSELRKRGVYYKDYIAFLLDSPPLSTTGIFYDHDIYLDLRLTFSTWLNKYDKRIETVLNRVNQYLIFELDYDNWIRPCGILLPKTPEEVADLYEYVKEVG